MSNVGTWDGEPVSYAPHVPGASVAVSSSSSSSSLPVVAGHNAESTPAEFSRPPPDKTETPEWSREYVGCTYFDPPDELITSEDLTKDILKTNHEQGKFRNLPICFEHIKNHPIGRATRSIVEPQTGRTWVYFQLNNRDEHARRLRDQVDKGNIKGLSLSHGQFSKRLDEISLVIYPRRENCYLVNCSATICKIHQVCPSDCNSKKEFMLQNNNNNVAANLKNAANTLPFTDIVVSATVFTEKFLNASGVSSVLSFSPNFAANAPDVAASPLSVSTTMNGGNNAAPAAIGIGGGGGGGGIPAPSAPAASVTGNLASIPAVTSATNPAAIAANTAVPTAAAPPAPLHSLTPQPATAPQLPPISTINPKNGIEVARQMPTPQNMIAQHFANMNNPNYNPSIVGAPAPSLGDPTIDPLDVIGMPRHDNGDRSTSTALINGKRPRDAFGVSELDNDGANRAAQSPQNPIDTLKRAILTQMPVETRRDLLNVVHNLATQQAAIDAEKAKLAKEEEAKTLQVYRDTISALTNSASKLGPKYYNGADVADKIRNLQAMWNDPLANPRELMVNASKLTKSMADFTADPANRTNHSAATPTVKPEHIAPTPSSTHRWSSEELAQLSFIDRAMRGSPQYASAVTSALGLPTSQPAAVSSSSSTALIPLPNNAPPPIPLSATQSQWDSRTRDAYVNASSMTPNEILSNPNAFFDSLLDCQKHIGNRMYVDRNSNGQMLHWDYRGTPTGKTARVK